jgi:hypothetical protein
MKKYEPHVNGPKGRLAPTNDACEDFHFSTKREDFKHGGGGVGAPPPILKHQIADLEQLLGAAIASAKIKRLTLQEAHENFNLRPQIHLILRSPTGSMKSTVLGMISKQLNVPVITETTIPGLVGTVDSDTHQWIPGAAWTARNSMLLLDEFKFDKHADSYIPLLALMEDQRYNRRLGLFSVPTEHTDGDLSLIYQNGEVNLKTRFSCVVASMKRFERFSSDFFKAFVNRTIPFEYEFSNEALRGFAEGKFQLNIPDYKPQPEVFIPRRKYFGFIRFVERTIKTYPASQEAKAENFLRSIGDVCRLYAATGKEDWDFWRKVIWWKLSVYDKVGRYYGKKDS